MFEAWIISRCLLVVSDNTYFRCLHLNSTAMSCKHSSSINSRICSINECIIFKMLGESMVGIQVLHEMFFHALALDRAREYSVPWIEEYQP